MKFDIVYSNPPYQKSLHLKIINEALKISDEVIVIHPARWFEDPLAEYKRSDKIAKKLKKCINYFILISIQTSCKTFNIEINSDLMISFFNIDKQNNSLKIYKNKIVQNIFNKIINYSLNNSIKSQCEKNKINGWRCEIKEMAPIVANSSGLSRKKLLVEIVTITNKSVFYNGYDENDKWWSTIRRKNKYSKPEGSLIPFSIKFNNKEEADNFSNSYKTKFIRRWIHIIKYDMHIPLFAIPYMNDYSHEWTDEDYCKFFNLTPEESEFMCRKIDDYRIKDFINYEI